MKRFYLLILLIFLLSNIIMSNCNADDNNDEINNFIKNYYLNKSTTKADLILKKIIKNKLITDDTYWSISYFFGRIAQYNNILIKKYYSIYNEITDDKYKTFLIAILKYCNSKEADSFVENKIKEDKLEEYNISKNIAQGILNNYNPILSSINNSNDLDMLWTEFFATGSEIAVKNIFEVIIWEDIIQDKVITFLNSEKNFNKKNKLLSYLKAFDININDDYKINNISYDFDIQIMNSIQKKQNNLEFNEIKRIIKLTDEEMYKMILKYTALWGLISNSKQHEKVYNILRNTLTNEMNKKNFYLKLIIMLRDKK